MKFVFVGCAQLAADEILLDGIHCALDDFPGQRTGEESYQVFLGQKRVVVFPPFSGIAVRIRLVRAGICHILNIHLTGGFSPERAFVRGCRSKGGEREEGYRAVRLVRVLKIVSGVGVCALAGCAAQRSGLVIGRGPGPHPWTNLEFNDSPRVFHFAVIADRTGGERPGVFESALRKVGLMQPAFVLCVGDLIEGYTDDTAEIARQWTELDTLVGGLTMPFFRVAGNHDVLSPSSAEYWQRHFGTPYYHFVYKNVLFLMLNTTVDGDTATLDSAQVGYLQKAVRDNAGVRWTFVLLHHPLWLYPAPSAEWEKVREALGGRPFTAFAGHFHRFVKTEQGRGRLYVVATTGGGYPREGTEASRFDNIVWVTVTDKGPRIASLLLDGVRDADSVQVGP